jgi:hypothetical protein
MAAVARARVSASSARVHGAARARVRDPRGCGGGLNRPARVPSACGPRKEGGRATAGSDSGLSPAWRRHDGGDDRWGPPIGDSGRGRAERRAGSGVGPGRPKARDVMDLTGEKELGRGLRWLLLGHCWASCCARLKREKT